MLIFSHPLRYFSLFLLLFISLSASCQIADPLRTLDAARQTRWVDSIYNEMNLNEKIGQLFMISGYSNPTPKQILLTEQLIKEYKIGGVIFFKGEPLQQAKATNHLQSISKTPLMVGIDGEWGLAMRLDSTVAYPWNMTLGAIEKDKLIREVGHRIGLHCKRMGIHINFAPDSDINSNSNNPIIGNRSFGENKHNVADKSIAFIQGMRQATVLSCVKHFPGHGDTDIDSHKALPLITRDRVQLEDVELYPFKETIRSGVPSIMVAHLNVPALDSSSYPSSLSKPIITGLLKEELQFNGLVITDALNMKGVSKFKEVTDAGLQSFIAGSDMLLLSEDVPKSIKAIRKVVRSNAKLREHLENSVKKILKAKYMVGLNHYQPISLDNIYDDLNTTDDRLLYEKIAADAITVIKNTDDILPIINLEKEHIAYISFGDKKGSVFYKTLNFYTQVDSISTNTNTEVILNKLEDYTTVIIGLHRSDANPWKDYQFTKDEVNLLQAIVKSHRVILNIFVNPYTLKELSLDNIKGVIVSYQNNDLFQSKSAQLIFGAISAKGRLPVSISDHYPVGTGIKTRNLKRLQYGLPESTGMDSQKLKKIDSLMGYMIKKKMAPGAQVLVARHGKVIYQKAFGYYTYERINPVKSQTLYDIASLSKIVSTLPLIMQLEESKTISLDTPLRLLLPESKHSNKSKISLKEMLSHYARFEPWIPFYEDTLTNLGYPSEQYYQNSPSKRFNIKVAKHLYLQSGYEKVILNKILISELMPKKEYLYSDFPYYFMKKFIERKFDTSLDLLALKRLFIPMGMNYTTYKPLEKFDKNNITPSENDQYFRHQILQGYVHDMGAAMQGGVGGHAGVFSNANDIAKLMQMYLQGGFYGGKRYLLLSTIDRFNTAYYADKGVRRGVGFDKKQALGDPGPAYEGVSSNSFGHSGFTGTLAWVDPETDIIYVFLSNRTYPTMRNYKLIYKNIRTRTQELIYKSIIPKNSLPL